MDYFDRLSFQQVLWFVPILFALHNLEEALLMKKWSKENSLPFHSAVTAAQFSIAVSLLTALAFAVTCLGMGRPKKSLGVYLIVAIQAIILVNAFLPHIVVSIRFRKYNPGLVTAIAINIPFSLYLFQRASAEGVVTLQSTLIMLAIAPLVMVVAIWFSLKLGGIVQTQYQTICAGREQKKKRRGQGR